MDFITNMMGLLLLVVCIVIVLIFLKDYLKLTGKNKIKDNIKTTSAMSVFYEIRYKGNVTDRGSLDMKSLPVQFGREAGYGNDIIVVPQGTPKADGNAVSRAWFVIQQDAREQLMIYSADPAEGGKRKVSREMKLLVDYGDHKAPARAVKLNSEVVLAAEKFKVILRTEA